MNEYKFIRDFKTFVDEINADNSRNYKISVLEKYKNNDCIKYFLKQVFDPFIIFGISDKKLNKTITKQDGLRWVSGTEDSEIFEYLKEHNTGTDTDIDTVQVYRAIHIADDCKDLFDKVVTKSLSIGVDTKTINKVMPKLISEFSAMLAEKYFEDPERIKGKSFAITKKIDGGRIIAIKEHGEVSFYTRQGQKYEGLVDLEEEMLRCLPDNICLDGEITLLNPGKLVSKDQYKRTMEITRADGEKHDIKMLIFDCMTADEFWARKCDKPYTERRKMLDDLHIRPRPFLCPGVDYTGLYRDVKYFEVLPILYQGSDIAMVQKILDEQVTAGEEGIMLNVLNAPYEFKRTWNLQKVKKMQTLDLEIVGYYEGKGKYKGTFGGFEARYKDGAVIKVGSGIDDDLRDIAWKNPASFIGKIIEVQYFETSNDKKGKESLRFPVFKDFRTDKNTPDY